MLDMSTRPEAAETLQEAAPTFRTRWSISSTSACRPNSCTGT